MTPGPRRPLVAVLDNEAAQAAADTAHPQHRRLVALMEVVSGRRSRRQSGSALLVPTAVRVEALLARQAPRAAGLGRLRVRDVELTASRADRAALLRSYAGGSTVDAVVAQCAEESAESGALVTVYTADLTDLPRLVAASRAPSVVVRRT